MDMQISKDHMAEMTPEVHKMINQLVNIQSKCLLQSSALASHRRAVDLLKVKSNFFSKSQTEIFQNWTWRHFGIDSNPWTRSNWQRRGSKWGMKRRNRIDGDAGWRF